ncbi:MAG: hypothetical protein GF317_25135 [Candidatus Lokiarchaeota archaeon]|nr:hypothetical protein [Candidatus Lokiarchaeota archaeon]MBD3202644.1 hypothetical protein [Candidatus Lokiarchaeota archaeon]
MADDIMLNDALWVIVNTITEKIKFLYNHEMTYYNWPNWVQAILLFEKSVVPCDDLMYFTEELYILAKKLVKECRGHNFKVEYYQRDKNGKKANLWIQDLSNNAKSVQNWIHKYENLKKK